LRELGDSVGRIYVLIRAKETRATRATSGAKERLKSDILDSSLFDTLRGDDAAKFEVCGGGEPDVSLCATLSHATRRRRSSWSV
jgi:hypothetical protein